MKAETKTCARKQKLQGKEDKIAKDWFHTLNKYFSSAALADAKSSKKIGMRKKLAFREQKNMWFTKNFVQPFMSKSATNLVQE